MYKISRSNKSTKGRYVLLAGFIAVASVGVLGILEFTRVTNFITFKKTQPTTIVDAITTSEAPTAQPQYNAGDERDTTIKERNEGTITDNAGSIPEKTPETSWTLSADKLITVYSPIKGNVIKTGHVINGESTYATVSFRLIDDVSGVIAQGNLSTVDGKFSGTFNFNTTGTEGRLDLFNAQLDGSEHSNVEIPVRFK